MKILVVDDELDEVESLSRGLRSKGYQVLQALSAQEALNHIHHDRGSIDLVITDYSMPLRNGIDLLNDIRSKDNHVPVMMMTAYAHKDMVIAALRNACDGFIEKPFTLEELLLEMERARVRAQKHTGTHPLSQNIPMLFHQINNPLTCISGSAERAISKLDDAEMIKKCFQRILASVDIITKLNREILDAGCPDTSRMSKVDLQEIIGDCLATLEDLLILNGISVENLSAQTSLPVRGYKFDLEQLFRNLLANAIDAFTGESKKLIRISAMNDEQKPLITISIEDTGCGIPKSLLDKIYDPYFTLKEKGTGLGLSVVKKILDEHGGKIEVKSVQGGGTQFLIHLPRYKDA